MRRADGRAEASENAARAAEALAGPEPAESAVLQILMNEQIRQ